MAKSENGRNGTLFNSGVMEVVVRSASEWQRTQPIVGGAPAGAMAVLVREPGTVESRLPKIWLPRIGDDPSGAQTAKPLASTPLLKLHWLGDAFRRMNTAKFSMLAEMSQATPAGPKSFRMVCTVRISFSGAPGGAFSGGTTTWSSGSKLGEH